MKFLVLPFVAVLVSSCCCMSPHRCCCAPNRGAPVAQPPPPGPAHVAHPGGPPQGAHVARAPHAAPGGGPHAAGAPGALSGPHGAPQGGPAPIERLAERLELTPEQRARVEELHARQLEKARALFERVRSGDLAPEEARAERERMREAFVEEMRKVLGPDQFEKFEKAFEALPPRGGPRPGGAPPRGPQLR